MIPPTAGNVQSRQGAKNKHQLFAPAKEPSFIQIFFSLVFVCELCVFARELLGFPHQFH